MKKILVFLTVIFIAVTTFIGCTPSQFKKGVEIDEDYPEDVLEIYDDATVFESEARFGKVKLAMGTNDDIEDIVEYYRDFYEYKNIVTDEEYDDDDEYEAKFEVDGYEFEIYAEEADGDAQKYFESVIEITVKKLEETADTTEKSEASQANTTSDDDPAQNADDAPTAQPTQAPQQKTVLDGESAIETITHGAWYSYSVFDTQKNDKYVDYTIWFEDDTSGSYHYFDYATGEKMDNEFTYEIVSGVLIINLDNNVQLLYDAYFDNEQLHLLNQYTDEQMYMRNWQKESNKTPNIGVFTAYGNWMTYLDGYAEPVCLALWEDGDGYIYNWNNDAASDRIMWDVKDNGIKFEVGTLYGDTLTLSHRADVLVITTSSGDMMYFNRVTTNVLSGSYELSAASEDNVSKWEAMLYPDGTATHTVSLYGIISTNYESDWYIDSVSGILNAYIFGEYAPLYYYFNEEQLVLYQPTDKSSYTFDNTDK